MQLPRKCHSHKCASLAEGNIIRKNSRLCLSWCSVLSDIHSILPVSVLWFNWTSLIASHTPVLISYLLNNHLPELHISFYWNYLLQIASSSLLWFTEGFCDFIWSNDTALALILRLALQNIAWHDLELRFKFSTLFLRTSLFSSYLLT
jgi:hypothetical protein